MKRILNYAYLVCSENTLIYNIKATRSATNNTQKNAYLD